MITTLSSLSDGNADLTGLNDGGIDLRIDIMVVKRRLITEPKKNAVIEICKSNGKSYLVHGNLDA